MARATSTTTMPTSRGVKSSFGWLPPIAIWPRRPRTTAVWYSALTSRSCHGLIPHSWGRCKPSNGKFYLGLWACLHRRGTGAQAHVSTSEARKNIRKWIPRYTSPYDPWDPVTVMFWPFVCVPGPLPLEEQTCRRPDVKNPWLSEAVRAVVFAGRQRLHARSPAFFWILRFLLRYPFNRTLCRFRGRSPRWHFLCELCMRELRHLPDFRHWWQQGIDVQIDRAYLWSTLSSAVLRTCHNDGIARRWHC